VTAFDELILEQSIRRRVGVPSSVVRVDRDSRLPRAAFRDVAEAVGGGPFQLVAVSDGVPGHFSLRGGATRTVVFHQRQVEVCAQLHELTTEQRFDATLLGDVFEGTMLRLVAEFLLQGGRGDQALSTLARSRRVQGGVAGHGWAPAGRAAVRPAPGDGRRRRIRRRPGPSGGSATPWRGSGCGRREAGDHARGQRGNK
jgi:hypothetical protein